MLKTVGNPSTRTGDQTIINGNLVIGTAGKGVDFSADPHAAGMTSELLDDYEEGTWTPSDLSGAGLVFSTAVGHYTKVGRLVTASFEVTFPVTANANNARISLPFTSVVGDGITGVSLTLTNLGSSFTGITVGAGLQFYDYSIIPKSNADFSAKIIRGVVTYFV